MCIRDRIKIKRISSNKVLAVITDRLKMEINTDSYIATDEPKHPLIKRLIKRSGVDHRMAKNIINSQLDIEKKIVLCDFMIWNCGNLEQLSKQIEFFMLWLKAKT